MNNILCSFILCFFLFVLLTVTQIGGEESEVVTEEEQWAYSFEPLPESPVDPIEYAQGVREYREKAAIENPSYKILVASYSDQLYAESFKQWLASKGFEAKIVELNTEKIIRFQVELSDHVNWKRVGSVLNKLELIGVVGLISEVDKKKLQ